MRKRYRVLLVAALVAALIVPVGFALSFESPSKAALARPEAVTTLAAPAVAVASIAKINPASVHQPMPDAFRLLLVGSMLFGIAAVIRKTI